jgi:hypothetical protein
MPHAKPIDLAELEKLASLMCTDADMAGFFGLARETFARRKAKTKAMQDAIERGRSKGRVSLRKSQFDRARAGDRTMLVWLGKQYLEQKDRVEHSGDLNLIAEELTAARDRLAKHYAEEKRRDDDA